MFSGNSNSLYNILHPDGELTEELIADEIPPRITNKLTNGELSYDQFVEIKFKDQVQIVGKCLPSPVDNLVFVFVKLGIYGSDKFYVCTWAELTEIISKNHSEYLEKHNGVRPKRWDSLHIAISEKHISQFENRWELIENPLK